MIAAACGRKRLHAAQNPAYRPVRHYVQLFSHTTKSIRLMPMSQSTVRKSAITTLRVLPLLALLAAVVREAKTSKPLRPAKLCLRWPTTH